MEEKLKIILEAFSVGDASEKLYGYCNKRTNEAIKNLLIENGYNLDIYIGRNKNSKYTIIIKICPVCNKKFETKERQRDEKETCSIACSNSYRPKRIKSLIKKKIQAKKKINKKFICKVCNNDFVKLTTMEIIKACSNECRNILYKEGQKRLIKQGEHKGWVSRNIISYPEKYFIEVLNNLGIKYEHNFTITQKELGSNHGYYYVLDFYIQKGNIKIDLEIDGKQHEYTKRKESDSLRDSLLNNNSYFVYRIKWKNLRSQDNKDYIKEEIEKFKNWYNKL